MYLVDQLLHRYDKRMYDQSRDLVSISSRANSDGYPRSEKAILYTKTYAYDISYRLERFIVGSLLVAAAIPTIILLPFAAAASLSLLFKANQVSDYVRRYFKMSSHLAITFMIVLTSVAYTPKVMKTPENDQKFSWMSAIDDPVIPFAGSKERLEISLKDELRKVQPLDLSLPEVLNKKKKPIIFPRQTFADYVRNKRYESHPNQKTLHVQLLGGFNEQQKEIAQAAADFAKHLFNAPVQMMPEILSFKELKIKHLELHENTGTKEGQKQYKEMLQADFPQINNAIGSYNALTTNIMLKDCVQDKIRPNHKNQLLTITTAPLHENQSSVYKKTNLENQMTTCAIDGLKEVDENNPRQALEKTVKRTLKIVAQEVAKIKGMNICKKHVCGMNDYARLKDLDEKEMMGFCAEHMAEIAYSTNTSLIELYKKMYQFLETFNDRYKHLNCDFTDAKRLIRNRVYALL